MVPRYSRRRVDLGVLGWFEPGDFHVVACGVPCTEFNTALTTRPRNLALGDQLALKALEIIEYLQPPLFDRKTPYGFAELSTVNAGYTVCRRRLLSVQ